MREEACKKLRKAARTGEPIVSVEAFSVAVLRRAFPRLRSFLSREIYDYFFAYSLSNYLGSLSLLPLTAWPNPPPVRPFQTTPLPLPLTSSILFVIILVIILISHYLAQTNLPLDSRRTGRKSRLGRAELELGEEKEVNRDGEKINIYQNWIHQSWQTGKPQHTVERSIRVMSRSTTWSM